MLEQTLETRQQPPAQSRRQLGTKLAVVAAAIVACCLVMPALLVFLGVLLVVAVALHAMSRSLQPIVQPILRVPVGRPGKRRLHLLLVAGAGLLFIVSGSIGAKVRSQYRSASAQHERQREAAEGRVNKLLETARQHLSDGDVEGAEFALLQSGSIGDVDADLQERVDDLLGRIRRSGDPQAILDVLVRLPQEEFDAFASGASVPEDLEFGERALDARAVEIAMGQLDQARGMRDRR